MKKSKRLLIVCIVMMCLALSACGEKTVDGGETADISMSWKEQYDLGIRLLAEGKYEEAILAFQAMIRIDPKRSESYHKLADAYIALGEYEKAATVLPEGFQATGTPSLEESLKNIQQIILEQKNQQGDPQGDEKDNQSGQGSSPVTPPALPDALVPAAEKDEGQILYYEEEYVVFDKQAMDLWTAVIAAGVNEDREGACGALDAMELDALKAISTVRETDYVSSVTGWTLWQGDLLAYAHHLTPTGDVSWSVEYRSENGTGFALSWSKRSEGANWNFYHGEMDHWLFEGDFHGIYEESHHGEITYTNATDGAASQELLHGAVTYRQEAAGAPVIMLYYHYENGIRQDVWVDPADGEKYPLRRVEIYPDGTESEVYMMFGQPDGLVLVNYVLGSRYVVLE